MIHLYKFLFSYITERSVICKKYGKILKVLKVVIRSVIIGNIKSLKRTVKTGRNGYRTIEESIINPRRDKRGYKIVSLRIYPKNYFLSVHRLVAEAFIPNPNNYPVINHIDSNPSNNNVNNLEWCTQSHNVKYAYANGNAKPTSGCFKKGNIPYNLRKISQFDKNNNFIRTFDSIKLASKFVNRTEGAINSCLSGRTKTSGGYIWRYVDK